jgi:general secretion pathway protein N
MNKPWQLISVSLVSYVVFMLLLTPAAWWVKLVPLPAGIQLGTVTGTLAQGKVSAVQYQHLYFSELQWQLNAWQLLTGKVQFDITSGSKQQVNLPFVNATVNYGINGLSLQNSILNLPVAEVMPLLQLPVPMAASGELVLAITEYRQGQPWCDVLQGNASWLDAKLQSLSGSWLDFQAFFATVQCEQGNIVLQTAADNVLGLAATLQLDNARFQLNGTLKPEPSLPEEVHQAMQFLGQPDANGRYTIKL